MNMGGPLSFTQAVMEAQQHIQDALRAGMGAQQPQQPQMPDQMPQGGMMPPQMPQPDLMQDMLMQQMLMQQDPQQMMPQMVMQDPQQMAAMQAMPQAMPQPMGSSMGAPQMGAPAQFAKGGLAVKKMAKGGAWTRKEGKNPEGGLNAKGRASLKAQGQDIKPPVSAKQAKKSPKSAARRKSFCARMGGMEGPMKDDKGRPTRKALALKKWDC